VDGTDAFDPESGEAAGIDLRRMLWVRCRKVDQVLRSTDLLLQGGGFGVVALDLSDLPQKALHGVPLATWFRFQRVIENTPTLLLLIGRESAAKSAAALVLRTHLKQAEETKRWAGLKAIGMTTNVTWRDGEERIETRYYILSKYLSAKRFAEAVRGHWGIENSCHWQLDVTFGEDQCRVRKDHADANLSILRRAALSLLKNEKTAKVGVKNKRLTAGWNEDYLAKVVFGT
jgi:predicted transposase YbfD/YdcC